MPIGLTERQRARLAREAERRHTTIAALIREAVDRTFPDGEERRLEARRRARAAFGIVHSGGDNLSERHDEFLGDLERW